MRSKLVVLLVIALGAIGTSCADADAPPGAGIRTEAPAEKPVIDDPMIAFEVRLLCDLQRRTFDSPEAIAAYRADLLAGAGISEQDYTAWKSDAPVEDRRAVGEHLAASCT